MNFRSQASKISPDCRTIYIRESVRHGQEPGPNTVNAVSEIDVAPELANAVKRYIAGRAFREKCGFHIFHRFRASWLRRNRVPWDLKKMWMGHAHKDLTDQYAEQLREDVKYRREWCEKIGLGFALPSKISQLSQPKRAKFVSRKAA